MLRFDKQQTKTTWNYSKHISSSMRRSENVSSLKLHKVVMLDIFFSHINDLFHISFIQFTPIEVCGKVTLNDGAYRLSGRSFITVAI